MSSKTLPFFEQYTPVLVIILALAINVVVSLMHSIPVSQNAVVGGAFLFVPHVPRNEYVLCVKAPVEHFRRVSTLGLDHVGSFQSPDVDQGPASGAQDSHGLAEGLDATLRCRKVVHNGYVDGGIERSIREREVQAMGYGKVAGGRRGLEVLLRILQQRRAHVNAHDVVDGGGALHDGDVLAVAAADVGDDGELRQGVEKAVDARPWRVARGRKVGSNRVVHIVDVVLLVESGIGVARSRRARRRRGAKAGRLRRHGARTAGQRRSVAAAALVLRRRRHLQAASKVADAAPCAGAGAGAGAGARVRAARVRAGV
ncbi:hypothetical protein FGB62_100g37 [Gracilaria domingensis]|nr:hypothetical protein FGB62_100g37 [Gracilaria domingensis]